jgi:hypothetical protein
MAPWTTGQMVRAFAKGREVTEFTGMECRGQKEKRRPKE